MFFFNAHVFVFNIIDDISFGDKYRTVFGMGDLYFFFTRFPMPIFVFCKPKVEDFSFFFVCAKKKIPTKNIHRKQKIYILVFIPLFSDNYVMHAPMKYYVQKMTF